MMFLARTWIFHTRSEEHKHTDDQIITGRYSRQEKNWISSLNHLFYGCHFLNLGKKKPTFEMFILKWI